MKIGYICDTLPFTHENFSGAEITCDHVSQTSKKLGNQVFFITSKMEYNHSNNKVYGLPSSHSKNFPVDLHIIFKLMLILLREKPDIIHLYTKRYLIPSVITCVFTKTRIVYSVVDYHMFCPKNILVTDDNRFCHNNSSYACSRCYYSRYPEPLNKFLAELRTWFFNWFISRTNAFLTFTEESRWRMESFGVDSDKIGVIYQYVMPKPIRTHIRFRHPCFLFVGSFVEHKGLETIVKAFKKVSKKQKCYLYIVGGGNPAYKQHILGIIKKMDIKNIYVLGKQNHEVVLSLIKKADVVVTNECWFSDFGNVVVVESLLLGVPVICSEMGTGSIISKGLWAFHFNANDYAKKMFKSLNMNHSKKPLIVLPDLHLGLTKVYDTVMINEQPRSATSLTRFRKWFINDYNFLWVVSFLLFCLLLHLITTYMNI